MNKKILLVTNGCTESWPTIEYAAGMAATIGAELKLLGVVEKMDELHPVEEIFSRAVALFQEKGLSYDLQIVNGETEEILGELEWDENTYLFIGPLGRSKFRQWLVGRSLRKILKSVPSPIFYTREARLPIKKILICFGGLEYMGKAEEIGLEIGKRAGAEVKFLHVIPPVESDHLPTQEPKENKEALLNDKPAHTLKKAQEHAKEKGIQANVIVRSGNIVNQILAELDAQRYDLICMGSTFSDPDDLRRLFAPNVTAEIAEAVNCPILTARCLDHLPSSA